MYYVLIGRRLFQTHPQIFWTQGLQRVCISLLTLQSIRSETMTQSHSILVFVMSQGQCDWFTELRCVSLRIDSMLTCKSSDKQSLCDYSQKPVRHLYSSWMPFVSYKILIFY